MWEMYLWLPVLTNSAYKPVKKKRKNSKTLKNKKFTRRIASNKMLRDKAFNIVKKFKI